MQPVEHYRILGQLGRGGFGRKYLGEHSHLSSRVVIKRPLFKDTALLDLAAAPALARGACVHGGELLELMQAASGERANLVRLANERRSYLLRMGRAGCEVETADLVLAGTRSSPVAVTGGDAGTVRAAVSALGLAGCRASDYPNFIEAAMAQLHRESYDDGGG
ncbi:MAG: hypothetical protein HY717_14455 [Planctomycetes bacterium]|nr:hypothetical protein [Planctomycetota bacterium]